MFIQTQVQEDILRSISSNFFGLRDRYDLGDFKEINTQEAKQILLLSNYFRFVIAAKKHEKFKKQEVLEGLADSQESFSYLKTKAGQDFLSLKLVENMYETNSGIRANQVQASNNLLMVFRFYDLLLTSQKKLLEVVNNSEKIPTWWSTKTIEFDDAERYQIGCFIDDMVECLTASLKEAFRTFTICPEEFFERYKEHKFWQSSLTQKASMIRKLSS